jgi:hypothetical protein
MLVAVDGEWVNEHFARLAEVIQEYDEALTLQWIPPGQRDEEADRKNPYRIFDTRSNRVVMFASELDTPQDILARLWGADNTKNSVLENLDANNAAAEALRLKEKMDEDDLRKDFVAFLIGTKKNYINTTNPITGEKVKFDDQIRRRE